MSGDLVATEEGWLPDLSAFLATGFGQSGAAPYFLPPEVLRWKYFASRGPAGSNSPRSYVIRSAQSIHGHVGIFPTEFRAQSRSPRSVPAVHMSDWLASSVERFAGTLLMFQAFTLAPMQYAFGCSPAARDVIVAAGFREQCRVPLYHKVHAPWNSAVWKELHGPFSLWPGAALRAADVLQSGKGWIRTGGAPSILTARRVERFGEETTKVIGAFNEPIIMTSRDASLLNHLIQHPAGCMSGWLLEAAGQVRGFAILGKMTKPGVRIGRIVELFLDQADPNLWADALRQLERQFSDFRPHVISVYGSTPWMEGALRMNGFFRRGRTALYVRDPEEQFDFSGNFHVTHFEADTAYI
jgi:hypothetical protein